jgi:hypothetical protein
MLTWPWDAVFQAAEAVARPDGSPTLGKLAAVLEALQRALSDEHDPAAEAVRELVAQVCILARGLELQRANETTRVKGAALAVAEANSRLTRALGDAVEAVGDIADRAAALQGGAP